VVPAVQQTSRSTGAPPLPAARTTFGNAAYAWLIDIRTNGLIRHAVWPGFGPQPAADAAMWMQWLAEHVEEPLLAAQLTNVAALVLAQVPSSTLYNSYGVGHVRHPLPALVFGAVLQNAAQARTDAQSLLSRFQPDGSVHYVAPSGGTDLGSTHYAPDANGLTADVVRSLLDQASFAGDRSLINTGLRHLGAMGKFRHTVPRGAQTWGAHTPDILASARSSLTRGHQSLAIPTCSSRRYWAWTG
jgi:hypothetical protein